MLFLPFNLLCLWYHRLIVIIAEHGAKQIIVWYGDLSSFICMFVTLRQYAHAQLYRLHTFLILAVLEDLSISSVVW